LEVNTNGTRVHLFINTNKRTDNNKKNKDNTNEKNKEDFIMDEENNVKT